MFHMRPSLFTEGVGMKIIVVRQASLVEALLP
jgi:hypothetical protein